MGQCRLLVGSPSANDVNTIKENRMEEIIATIAALFGGGSTAPGIDPRTTA